jgi:hypothetical protein
MGERLGRSALIVAGGVSAVAVMFWLAFGPEKKPVPPDVSHDSAEWVKESPLDVARAPAMPPVRVPPQLPDAEAPAQATEEGDFTEDLVPAPDSDAIAAAWSVVDLEELRKALPDNVYFELSAPTNDPDLIAERQAERERWNVEYGKILSGTGTEKEIRDYYDQRALLSTDYVEFTTYLLDHYTNELPERDVGLLQLARRLHLARLEEIPRKVEEALERKREQDAVREAWLADEARFGAADHDEGGDE